MTRRGWPVWLRLLVFVAFNLAVWAALAVAAMLLWRFV